MLRVTLHVNGKEVGAMEITRQGPAAQTGDYAVEVFDARGEGTASAHVYGFHREFGAWALVHEAAEAAAWSEDGENGWAALHGKGWRAT